MFKPLAALLFVGALTSAAAIAQQLPPQPKVRPAGMPAGAVMISPCVATMGEHWANPKDLPFGPIYGTYKGQLVFTEVMISKKDFESGKAWSNVLKPLPGHAIDHVDIWYEPTGHEGYPIPHYDVHAFYVADAAHMAFCPDGIKVPDTVVGKVMK